MVMFDFSLFRTMTNDDANAAQRKIGYTYQDETYGFVCVLWLLRVKCMAMAICVVLHSLSEPCVACLARTGGSTYMIKCVCEHPIAQTPNSTQPRRERIHTGGEISDEYANYFYLIVGFIGMLFLHS